MAFCRDEIIEVLRAHEDELKGEGLLSLSLFGSVARGEPTAESDIDLATRFDYAKISLVDLVRLTRLLRDLLQAPVDLVDEANLKPFVRPAFKQDHIRVY